MNNFLNIKKDFPIFSNHPDLVYLDNAATSQKPKAVIGAVCDFYKKYNSNVHRGIYTLNQDATRLYERTRKKVADFIGADDPSEIIFTGNASEAINLVAYGFAGKYLKSGDIIILSEMEHHSNIVSWLRLKEEKGVKLFFIPIDDKFELNYKAILKLNLPKNKIKLVTLTHASNVLGTINPIAEIVDFLKKNGIKAKILIDGAQSVPHISVDVKKLSCDFFVLSSHKMLGSSGVGVLWAKKELLEKMDPLFVGSHMIKTVSKDKAIWADVPDKFETGTGRLEGVVGLGAAIDYIQKIGIQNVEGYETQLTNYAFGRLVKIKKLKLYANKNIKDRLGVFSFNIDTVHPHDVAEILNRSQICVRSGHHCAQPLMNVLGVPATVRASLYIYNTKEDINELVEGIKEVKRIFRI